MSKKEIKILNDVLGKIKKIERFILDDTVKITKRYGNNEIELNKNIGSDICYLYRAIETLEILTKTEGATV